MTRRRVPFVLGIAVLVATGAAGGCGQQGPLVLPPDARPVERLETSPVEPESSDDERDER